MAGAQAIAAASVGATEGARPATRRTHASPPALAPAPPQVQAPAPARSPARACANAIANAIAAAMAIPSAIAVPRVPLTTRPGAPARTLALLRPVHGSSRARRAGGDRRPPDLSVIALPAPRRRPLADLPRVPTVRGGPVSTLFESSQDDARPLRERPAVVVAEARASAVVPTSEPDAARVEEHVMPVAEPQEVGSFPGTTLAMDVDVGELEEDIAGTAGHLAVLARARLDGTSRLGGDVALPG